MGDALNRLHELAGERRDGMVGERPERGQGSGPQGQDKREQRLHDDINGLVRLYLELDLPLARVFSVLQDLLIEIHNQLEPIDVAPLGTAADILQRCADTYRQRNAVYKDNYVHIGDVMAGFFPNGITLKTPVDHIRFHLFMLAMVKYTRYTNNWANGHSDSLVDAAVYPAMLEQVDGQMLRSGLGAFPRKPAKGHPEFGNFTDPENQPCPCWKTGQYVWVEGCPGHPRESMT